MCTAPVIRTQHFREDRADPKRISKCRLQRGKKKSKCKYKA